MPLGTVDAQDPYEFVLSFPAGRKLTLNDVVPHGTAETKLIFVRHERNISMPPSFSLSLAVFTVSNEGSPY